MTAPSFRLFLFSSAHEETSSSSLFFAQPLLVFMLLFHLEISRLVHAESERNQTKSNTKRAERGGKEEDDDDDEARPFSSQESAVKRRRLILFCGKRASALERYSVFRRKP